MTTKNVIPIRIHVAVGKENHIDSDVAGTWPLRPKCGGRFNEGMDVFFKREVALMLEYCEPCVECFSEGEFPIYLLGNV